jgi:hypothetical protein
LDGDEFFLFLPFEKTICFEDGMYVGWTVGLDEGFSVMCVGDADGMYVGNTVGTKVGELDGITVGDTEVTLEASVEFPRGETDGMYVGIELLEGTSDGLDVG